MAMELMPAPCGDPDSLATWRRRFRFVFKQLLRQFLQPVVYRVRPYILWPPRGMHQDSSEASVILPKPSSNGGGLNQDEWPSEGVKFTMTPSRNGGFPPLKKWNGGFDINIGSHIIRVPKYLRSVSGESVQDGSMFHCPKAFVPKCVIDMVNRSLSSAKGRRASGVSAKRELGKAEEDGGTIDGGALGSVSSEVTHDQKISKLRKTDDRAPGSEPDKTDWQQHQQQQQQQEEDTLNGVNHVGGLCVPARVDAGNEEGCIVPACQGKMETASPIHLGENSADSGSVICETVCKIISGLAAAEHLNEQHFPKEGAEHMQQGGNGVWANSTMQEKRACHHGEQDHQSVLSGCCGGAYVVAAENAISIALKNNHPATPCWLIASAVPHHATGNRDLLSGFAPVEGDLFVKTGDAGAAPMRVVGTGNVVTDAVVLADVWYVPGLVANLVSVSQLAELDYSVAFGGGRCYVKSAEDGVVAGAARAGEDGLFAVDFIRVPLGL